jgi:hypothetical protein
MNDIITHTFIELYYSYGGWLITEERSLPTKGKKALFENYGVFDGCEETSKYIANNVFALKDNINRIELQPKYLSGITDKIVVNIVDSGNSINASYMANNKPLTHDYKFESITINVKRNLPYSTMNLCLMHELIHAYQDYNLRVKGSSLYDKGKNSDYFNVRNFIGNDDEILNQLSLSLYFIDSSETGAIMSELKGEINNRSGGNFRNITDAIDFLKTTRPYKIYSSVYDFMLYLNHIKNDNNASSVVFNAANKILPDKFNTYNQFLKWFSHKVIYAKKKADTLLPKIACEYIKINLNTPSFPIEENQFIQTTNEERIRMIKNALNSKR